MTSSRQRDGVPAPADEIEVGILEEVHATRCSASRCCCGATSTSSNIVRDTNTAVNTLDSRPMVSVVAKPRIGPVPNWKRNAAEMSEATCVSRIVRKTRSKPAATACLTRLGVCSSSLMRSKISTFESTPMPIVRMKPAMPGSVITAPRYAISPSRMIRLTRNRDQRVEAGQLVVDDHEDQHEDQPAQRRRYTGANRFLAERRADRALFEIGHRRGQRAGAQHERQIGGLLLREAALDDAVAVDAAVDARRRVDAVVEHDRQLPVDVGAGERAELRRAFVGQREAHRRTAVLNRATAARCAGRGRSRPGRGASRNRQSRDGRQPAPRSSQAGSADPAAGCCCRPDAPALRR